MEHRKITLRHELITPDSAQSIVTQELYAHQRPLSQAVVREYALAMRNGDFRQGTVISFCLLDGRRYLINGQHTLHAVILVQQPLEVAVEEIAVESAEELARYYGQFDRVRLRSLQHIYQAHAIHESLNLNKSQAVCLGACLPLFVSGFSQIGPREDSLRMYTANPRLRMACMEHWVAEASMFFSLIKGAPGVVSMNIRRAPVMAVALVTLRFAPEEAEDFWQNACQDDGLAQADPRHTLHLFLRTTKAGEFAPHQYSRYVAAAWNAGQSKRRLKNISPQPEHLPIVLTGTPHDGKHVYRYVTPQGDMVREPQWYLPGTWQKELFGLTSA
ncbi:MAG TPA: hypothetical protein VF077_12705 [Nitrospiraceae bacterium]